MNEEISKSPKEGANRVLELPNSYLEKGREEGIEEGRELVKRQFVLNMLKKGISNQLIAEIVEVDVGEVKEIKKEWKANRENQ